jgi:hypothetical protein
MPRNSPSVTYCLASLSDRRIWVSASLPALLWCIPLIAIGYFDSGRNSEGGQRFWERVPFGMLTGFTILYVLALVMHLLFRERVQRLRGKRFWLFPFTSLTVAALMFSSVGVLGAFAEGLRFGGIRLQWIMTPIYWWIGSLVVMFFHIWLTYPLAIINQLIIRKVFGISRG